jgi:hypothetical protein
VVVPVPEGTVVKDRDGTLLADLISDGDRFLVAAGGRGGKGNARFLSNSRRAPELGRAGREGRGALAAPRAEADGRRRPRRACRTPARARSSPPSRRPAPASPTTPSPPSCRTSASSATATPSWWWPTSPASSRGRARGGGSASSSCATSSGPACWWCSSTSARSSASRPTSRSGSSSTSSCSTSPTWASAPHRRRLKADLLQQGGELASRAGRARPSRRRRGGRPELVAEDGGARPDLP